MAGLVPYSPGIESRFHLRSRESLPWQQRIWHGRQQQVHRTARMRLGAGSHKEKRQEREMEPAERRSNERTPSQEDNPGKFWRQKSQELGLGRLAPWRSQDFEEAARLITEGTLQREASRYGDFATSRWCARILQTCTINLQWALGLQLLTTMYSAKVSLPGPVESIRKSLLHRFTRPRDDPQNILKGAWMLRRLQTLCTDHYEERGEVWQRVQDTSWTMPRSLRKEYASAIMALGRAGSWREAFHLLASASSDGLQPRADMYDAALDIGHPWEMGFNILRRRALHEGAAVDTRQHLNKAVQMSARMTAWQRACVLMDTARAASLECSVSTFTSIAHPESPAWSAGLHMLGSAAVQDGITLDTRAIQRLLNTVAYGRQWEMATTMIAGLAEDGSLNAKPQVLAHLKSCKQIPRRWEACVEHLVGAAQQEDWSFGSGELSRLLEVFDEDDDLPWDDRWRLGISYFAELTKAEAEPTERAIKSAAYFQWRCDQWQIAQELSERLAVDDEMYQEGWRQKPKDRNSKSMPDFSEHAKKSAKSGPSLAKRWKPSWL